MSHFPRYTYGISLMEGSAMDPTPVGERFYTPGATFRIYLDTEIIGEIQPITGRITHHDPIRIHIDNQIEIPRSRIVLIERVEDDSE